MKLFWLDLETTGLDPRTDLILEIAVSVAEIEAPFDATPVYHAVLPFNWKEHLAGLPTRVVEMHEANGLWRECRDVWRSRLSGANCRDYVQELLSIIPDERAGNRDDMPTLAGSSVHFDLGFIRSWMPDVANRLSHRVYDVSAVKLFCRSLGMPPLPRSEAHRARDDVRESIEHARACAAWLGKFKP